MVKLARADQHLDDVGIDDRKQFHCEDKDMLAIVTREHDNDIFLHVPHVSTVLVVEKTPRVFN